MGEYETRRQKRKSSLDSGANRSPGKMMDPDPVHRYEQMESAGQQSASPGPARSGDCISDEIAERDSRLACAKQMIEILTLKVEKLEQLMALKDGKIQALTMQLQQDDMGANYDDDDNSIK
uniref:Uncharacterized protein n=1 Tax=Spongospora subterranea TaxID=70186 RepID=A0A0H5QMT7_9EUKA|eukprot:CRZ03288.1 hypothetical protein [Spongospora subterranea]